MERARGYHAKLDALLTRLLDLDGTLTDPHDGIVGSIRHALRCLGEDLPPDARLARYIGPTLAESFGELLGVSRDSERVALAIAHYRERFSDRGWRENRVYPRVPGFLDTAGARGWRRVIATSKPRVFAERIAVHFDLRRRLDAIYGSKLDGRLGAKPELVAHVLASESVPPEQAVMIGDRRHDVEGARANGLASIGVTWGYASPEELETAGASYLCDDVDSVLEALDALSSS